MSFDSTAFRAAFPLLAEAGDGSRVRYLDSASTAQTPLPVLEAIAGHERTHRANVHRGVYALAEAATQAYEGARAALASYLGVRDPAEIVFTSGTTGAINLVAHSFGALLRPGDEVVISRLEHHSNIVPWQMLRDRAGIVLKALDCTADGRLDLATLDRVVTPRCRLIAVTHCSNVTGAVSDVATLAAAARAVGARVLLDGAQIVPHGPLDLPGLGIDFYAFSGHKAFGPNGIGALWGRRELLEAMPPFLGGGEMIRSVSLEHSTFARVPHKFEAGTPPIAQAVGLGAALRWLAGQDWTGIAAHESALVEHLLRGLSGIPGLRLLGPGDLQRRVGVVSFDLEGVHPHDLCQFLDDRHRLCLRGGHHCAQPLMDRFALAATTRASLAPYNDRSDIDALLGALDDARNLLA